LTIEARSEKLQNGTFLLAESIRICLGRRTPIQEKHESYRDQSEKRSGYGMPGDCDYSKGEWTAAAIRTLTGGGPKLDPKIEKH